jgi:cytochrome c5
MEGEIAMIRYFLCVIALTAILVQLHAAPQSQSNTAGSTKDANTAAPKSATKDAKNSPSQADDGEHVFQQQCSRCHNTPEGFSPRISGTIVRHMRVRASLSQSDEQKLLRFLNP